MKFTQLTKEEQDATLAQFRRDQAQSLEELAIRAEVQAEQFKAVKRLRPRDPQVSQMAAERAQAAHIDRKRADELHERAGTSPADFTERLVNLFTQELRGLELNALRTREMADHSEIYGGTADERERQAIEAEEAVKAMQTMVDRLSTSIDPEA